MLLKTDNYTVRIVINFTVSRRLSACKGPLTSIQNDNQITALTELINKQFWPAYDKLIYKF